MNSLYDFDIVDKNVYYINYYHTQIHYAQHPINIVI